MTSSSSSAIQTLLFVIVGKNEPLYEAEFLKRGTSASSDAVTRQNYFVLHSSLDLVEHHAWTTNQMFLKMVDKVNHQQVSCFCTAGNIKFLLLHGGGKSEDSIKNFFQEVYELYVKLSMNPFYAFDTAITSPSFDSRVRAVARRYLL